MTKNLHFAIRKQLIAVMLRQFGRDWDRDFLLPRMDLANNIDQLAGRHTLEHVSTRPCRERSPNLVVAPKTSKDDEPCVRKLIADGDHGFYAAYIWKPDFREDHVRFVLTKILNSLPSGGSLRHQQHVWLSIDNAGNSHAPQGMVINGQNPDLLAHTSSSSRIQESSSRITPSGMVV